LALRHGSPVFIPHRTGCLFRIYSACAASLWAPRNLAGAG
jgi:hypothetical protein